MRRQTASVIRMGTWTVSSSNAEWRVASKHATVVVVAEAKQRGGIGDSGDDTN